MSDNNHLYIATIKRKNKDIADVFIDKDECVLHSDDIEMKTQRKNKKLQTIEYTTRNQKEINCIGSDTIQLVPNSEQKQVYRLNLFGPPGCGKSTFLAKYFIEYNKMYPDRTIYMFSSKLTDEAFNDVDNLEYIELDELYNSGPLTQDDFKNCLVVFDDVNSIPDKKLKDIIHKTREQLLTVGRSNNIDICCTHHKGKASTDSMMAIETGTHHIIFPRSNRAQNIGYLKDKLQLDKKIIEELMNQKTRYIVISSVYPTYYITENKIKII